jgi:hypothetical protein
MLLNNEATRLCSEGRFEDAETLFIQALGIWEKAFGPISDPVLGCCQSLGILCLALGDFDGAIFHVKRAVEIANALPEADAKERAFYRAVLVTLESGDRVRLQAAQGVARTMWKK